MKTCWVVTEGKAGMELQGIALAEALNINEVLIKRSLLKFPWSLISPSFRLFKKFSISKKGDQLAPPYPDLVITVGRRSVILGLYIKEKSPSTKLICINNPRINNKYFDVVIPSKHDGLSETNNVVPVLGSVHRINKKRLEIAKLEFENTFKALPTPRIGVIIGGNNKYYKMDIQTAENLITQLKQLQQKYNASFIITASRRTPENILNLFLKLNLANTFYWDNRNTEVQNPYIGILSCADALIVTCESSNMISEACATDLPVYLFKLPGENERFNNLHADLIALNRIKWLENEIDFSKKTPIDSMSDLVRKVEKLLKNKAKNPD